MNWFESFIYAIQFQADIQKPYGWFHILFLCLMLILVVLVIKFFKNSNSKTNKIILFCCWIVMFLLEIYKQLVLSFSYTNGVKQWSYDWYSFPFQFCSTPIYVLPFCFILKNKKIVKSLESFLATYCLMAGLVVMFYPNSVFQTNFIGIAVQSMIHHSLMVVVGAYLLARNRSELNIKFFVKGIIPFIALVCFAIILNESVIYITSDVFNMFFISSHYRYKMPVFEEVVSAMPYLLYLSLYVIGLTVLSFLVFIFAKYICKLFNKITVKKEIK